MILRLISFLLLMQLLIVCKSAENQSKGSYEQIALTKLGTPTGCVLNKSGTLVLCQQKRNADHINRTIHFLVIEIGSNKILYRNSFQNGYVCWFSENEIEVSNLRSPKLERESQNEVKRINILTNQE